MAEQPELFDDIDRKPDRFAERAKRNGATPADVGSGPEGETCRTCQHAAKVHYHDSHYFKCGLMENHWTHGPGTDIRLKWAACFYWEKCAEKESAEQ